MATVVLRIIVSVSFFVLLLTAYSFFKALAIVKLGDPSPSYRGRVSLNPMDHFDPTSFLVLVVIAILTGGQFLFAWPKPIDYNSSYFNNPKRDEILVSLAGPLGLLLIAWLSLKIGSLFGGPVELALGWFSYTAVWLFIWLLLPIRPMDGERIVRNLLPDHLAYKWDDFQERYNFYLFLAIVFILIAQPGIFLFIQGLIMALLQAI